jgi:hypothetical protein
MEEREQTIRELLSEALDLCVRARKMDAMDRRAAALAASSDPAGWQASGSFGRYVERHNVRYPLRPISTRSGTVSRWFQDQYDKDLVDWEARTRRALMKKPCDD